MKAFLVEDSMNFKRGGDPLSSMGLGGFSFDSLRPGAILQSKKYFGITGKTGNIVGYHSGATRISAGDYLLITNIEEGQKPGEKNIHFRKYAGGSQDFNEPEALKTVKRDREKFASDGVLPFWGPLRGFARNISKKRFDYRFRIIEAGFHDTIAENTNFIRGINPKRALGLGIPFGFTTDLLGLEANDGRNGMYITREFAEKYFLKDNFSKRVEKYHIPDFKARWGGWRGKNYINPDGSYKGSYACTFKIISIGNDLFRVQGSSGDYGFGGLQSSQRNTIGKEYRKSIYEQLYYYLMNLWKGDIHESLKFRRGVDPKATIGIGRKFYNIIPGTILKPLRDIYISDSGKFVSYSYFKKIWEESYIIVLNSEVLPTGLIKIFYHQAWDLDAAKAVRAEQGIYKESYYSAKNYMIGTEKQFQNRFEIYES
jgi:hypothetical protein